MIAHNNTPVVLGAIGLNNVSDPSSSAPTSPLSLLILFAALV
jgi:hypothetical protein